MATKIAHRALLILVVVLLLAVLVPPFINVNRYRGKMADSLSRAVGRPVSLGSIELKIIPQPGFELENVVIGDDPAISSEPILRAESVTADLRLSSLWRGRLEIARLNLKYPSLNLVEGPDGHWNIESLLWRASRTAVAPTSQRRPEVRVRFPYIEVDNGRVNLKRGVEKSVFSLTDADFALWSPTENHWQMRIEGRPVRTDTNISDTGTIKADLSFTRAEMLVDTPIQGKIVWEKGQLGMLTKLIYGRDRGWRGLVNFSAEVSGSANALHFKTATSLQDFRRFDIYANDPMSFAFTCNGIASIPHLSATGFGCQLPINPGLITLGGTIGPRGRTYQIATAVESVNLSSIVAIFRHVKNDIPQDLSATGMLNIAANLHRDGPDDSSRTWTGSGSTTAITLNSASLKEPITLKPLHIDLSAPGAKTVPVRVAKASSRKGPKPELLIPNQFLAIQPFEVALGGKLPASMSMKLATDDYRVSLSGPARIENIFALARTVGLGAPKVNLTGDLTADLIVDGQWKGFGRPEVNGTARILNSHAEIPGISEPIQIAQSDIALTGNQLHLSALDAKSGALHFTGSAIVPRYCDGDMPCAPTVDLQFDDLNLGSLDALLNPTLKKQPWYKLIGSTKEESILTRIGVVGRLRAKRFTVGKLVGTSFYTDFKLSNGELVVSNLRENLFDGVHAGEWHADFNGSAPAYSGHGTLSRANMALLAPILKDSIGTGLFTGRYDVKMTGWNPDDLSKSADASTTLEWKNGTLKTIWLDHGSTRFTSLAGTVTYANRILHIGPSKMSTTNGIYTVSGTADSDYSLELMFVADSGLGYKVTGPLHAPEVVAISKPQPTEASLKP